MLYPCGTTVMHTIINCKELTLSIGIKFCHIRLTWFELLELKRKYVQISFTTNWHDFYVYKFVISLFERLKM